MRITVTFKDVLDLVPQTSVKVNDVSVGKVESITLDGWNARVGLAVRGDVKLAGNARAEIRQTALLGEKYVELLQPTQASPVGQLADGDSIDVKDTGRNPEIEEIFGAISLVLSGSGLSQIKRIVHELNAIFDGRQAEIRDLIGQLNTFIGALDAQKAAILDAIDKLDSLTTKLNNSKKVITDTLDTMPQAIKSLSAQRTEFVGLLQSVSKFGDVATNVMKKSNDNLVDNLENLKPILTELRKGAADLPKAVDILSTAPFPNKSTTAIKGDYVDVVLKFPGLCLDDVSSASNPYGNCAKVPGWAKPSSFSSMMMGGG